MASVNMFLAPATTISTTTTATTTTTTTTTIPTTTSIATTRARRVRTFATAAKGSGKSSEEKGFLEWLAGALEKKDGFVETDPILQKVEGKSGGTTTISGKKTTGSAATQKKSGAGDEGGFGGFGGLFPKK